MNTMTPLHLPPTQKSKMKITPVSPPKNKSTNNPKNPPPLPFHHHPKNPPSKLPPHHPHTRLPNPCPPAQASTSVPPPVKFPPSPGGPRLMVEFSGPGQDCKRVGGPVSYASGYAHHWSKDS